MNKLIIPTIIILVIIILVGGIYIGYNELQKERIRFYQGGVQDGSLQTIVTIINQAVTCNPVTLNYQNQTYQLKEVRC